MASESAEFNTSTNDVEERKRMRRKRIEKNVLADAAANSENQERDVIVQKTGQQQVDESLAALDQRKHAGLKLVTEVRIETNDAEARRRVDDEQIKKNRLMKLQQEALTSAKANAAIEMKWTELLEKEIPQVII